MAKKSGNEVEKTGIVFEKPMSDIMHDSMMPYAEYVILERALPRVEDGLKPVQRRILYTMHELSMTPDKPHRKCARIVGDCLGKFHPHGDTSVYDAMVRMAQPFNMRGELVDGHGNFGSIDGDSPAAMRYTEARMAPLAVEMLRDIDKDTVDFSLNFDDTLKEPDTLPSRYPNLLVNGSSGIAVGLATNIPPHNLREVVAAVEAQIDKPDISVMEIMQYLPGPDFPTGANLINNEEIINAYATRRGKLTLRAKVDIETEKNGKKLLVISEIPYQVNKASMLERILKIIEERKGPLAAISDIRDESDRDGMRAVIELKKDSDADVVLAYLYKYADLQVTYGVNIVAIAGGKPQQMGIKDVISHYINYQKEIVTRRTKYDLDKALARAHILEGLMKALDDLDRAIAIIRASKDAATARIGLMEAFDLTEIQAQAILDLRLQRLTGLEILTLQKEYDEIKKLVAELQGVLASEKKLINIIKKELHAIAEKYGDDRRTKIIGEDKNDITDIVREIAVQAEETAVLLTNAGFIKRMPPKALERSDDAQEEPMMSVISTMTDKKLLFFTDYGNVYTLPSIAVPECKLKDRGALPGSLLEGLEAGEKLIAAFEEADAGEFVFVTQGGMIKRSECSDYGARRGKLAAINLKAGDKLFAVEKLCEEKTVMLISQKGMSINFKHSDVPTTGRATGGVKGMSLDAGDKIAGFAQVDPEGELLLITDRGYAKRNLVVDHELQARAGKGLKTFQFTRGGANGTQVAGMVWVKEPLNILVLQKDGSTSPLNSDEVMIEPRFSKGKPYVLVLMDNTVERFLR